MKRLSSEYGFLCGQRCRAIAVIAFLTFLVAAFPLFDLPPPWLLLTTFVFGSAVGGLHLWAFTRAEQREERGFNLLMGFAFTGLMLLLVVSA